MFKCIFVTAIPKPEACASEENNKTPASVEVSVNVRTSQIWLWKNGKGEYSSQKSPKILPHTQEAPVNNNAIQRLWDFPQKHRFYIS